MFDQSWINAMLYFRFKNLALLDKFGKYAFAISIARHTRIRTYI